MATETDEQRKLRDLAEDSGCRQEAERVIRQTRRYGKNWRAEGGARICVSMSDAIASWEKQTGLRWEDVFGKGAKR